MSEAFPRPPKIEKEEEGPSSEGEGACKQGKVFAHDFQEGKGCNNERGQGGEEEDQFVRLIHPGMTQRVGKGRPKENCSKKSKRKGRAVHLE